VDVVQKVAGAMVAIGLGSFPLWVALFVAEIRNMRGRVRTIADRELGR
jgi:hypothetical protein